ncbi:ampp [Symbiodinium sp. KB8]|nr:ampp [Symbiodinium sp. KB8]
MATSTASLSTVPGIEAGDGTVSTGAGGEGDIGEVAVAAASRTLAASFTQALPAEGSAALKPWDHLRRLVEARHHSSHFGSASTGTGQSIAGSSSRSSALHYSSLLKQIRGDAPPGADGKLERPRLDQDVAVEAHARLDRSLAEAWEEHSQAPLDFARNAFLHRTKIYEAFLAHTSGTSHSALRLFSSLEDKLLRLKSSQASLPPAFELLQLLDPAMYSFKEFQCQGSSSANLEAEHCPCCYRPGKPFCDDCDPKGSADRLQGLRALLKAHELDAYIVTSEDAHGSEYVASADERRSFLTGFSGSAGSAIVTEKQALLWTDSRYFLQAEKQLAGTEWVLMRQFQPSVPSLADWVRSNLNGKCVGVDLRFVPAEVAKEWTSKWGSHVCLKEVKANLVDAIWTTRPDDPCNPVELHPLDLAGESVPQKIRRVREAVDKEGANVCVVSALDQIAWLFNLRGSDIEYNPLFFSYAAIFPDRVLLFLRGVEEGGNGLCAEVQASLAEAGVTVRPYMSFFDELPNELGPEDKVFLDSSFCSLATLSMVKPELRVHGLSPIERFKASKNAVEISGIKKACKRDSIALCELFAKLRRTLCRPNQDETPPTEFDVCQMMQELRRKQQLYVGDSFHTISSVGSNSAVVHYQPERDNSKVLQKSEIYLIDTGAQYKDGTTDVTRTVHFGNPSAEQKRIYTRVLQGHLSLAKAVFPEGTPGLLLDAYARGPLWQDGLQYGHGTGHGIGAYLNVHEGPAQIGGGSVPGDQILASERRRRLFLQPIVAGSLLSDEPGCYKEGEFGVRIESDILAVPATMPYKMANFLKFECLTLVPMCRELVEVSLLSPAELTWLNEYHALVWAELSEVWPEGAEPRTWLWDATRPLHSA